MIIMLFTRVNLQLKIKKGQFYTALVRVKRFLPRGCFSTKIYCLPDNNKNQYRISMIWRPSNPHSPQNSSLSLLKNSRLSDHSTEIDRSFKINHSFEFESTFSNDPASKNTSFLTSIVSPINSQTRARKWRQAKPQEIKKQYLSKMLINRMLNIRTALKEMSALPIKIFKKNASFTIAKELLMKTKLNVQTSVLRTLVFAEEYKSVNESELKCTKACDVFVLPTASETDDSFQQRQAILKLLTIINVPIRSAIKAIKGHCDAQNSVIRYFGKLCSNYQSKRESAFEKMRQLPNAKGTSSRMKGQLIGKQLKLCVRIIEEKHAGLLNYSMTALKYYGEKERYLYQGAAKQIVAFSQLRKEHCLREWLNYTRSKNHQEMHVQQVDEAKLEAVARIVQRNYLKLFMQVNRRLYNFRKVAKRVACGSKINEQKSLWRLLVHMQKQVQTSKQ